MQDLWKRLQYPRFPWTGANSFCSLRSREHASIFFEILNAYSICACSSVYTYIQDSIQYHSHVCTFDIYIIMYHISKVHTCRMILYRVVYYIYMYIHIIRTKSLQICSTLMKRLSFEHIGIFHKKIVFLPKIRLFLKIAKKNSMFPWFWKGSKKDLKR